MENPSDRRRPIWTLGPDSDVEISYASFEGFDEGAFRGSAQRFIAKGLSFIGPHNIVDMDTVDEFSFTDITSVPGNRPASASAPQQKMSRQQRRAEERRQRKAERRQ